MPHDQAEQRFHSDEDAKKKKRRLVVSLKRPVVFPTWNSNAARWDKSGVPNMGKKRTLAMDYTLIKMFLAYFFKIKHYFS